jgi:DNA-binding CsgD family transcriptional regulator
VLDQAENRRDRTSRPAADRAGPGNADDAAKLPGRSDSSGRGLRLGCRQGASKRTSRPYDELPDLFGAGEWQALAESLRLTRRQAEIAALVCKALSNKEIGGQLGISPHTVRMHLNGLLERLRVANRVGVVVRLVMAHRAMPSARRR